MTGRLWEAMREEYPRLANEGDDPVIRHSGPEVVGRRNLFSLGAASCIAGVGLVYNHGGHHDLIGRKSNIATLLEAWHNFDMRPKYVLFWLGYEPDEDLPVEHRYSTRMAEQWAYRTNLLMIQHKVANTIDGFRIPFEGVDPLEGPEVRLRLCANGMMLGGVLCSDAYYLSGQAKVDLALWLKGEPVAETEGWARITEERTYLTPKQQLLLRESLVRDVCRPRGYKIKG